MLQDFSLQHNLYNAAHLPRKNVNKKMKRATMYLQRYELDCHPGLVATNCNVSQS